MLTERAPRRKALQAEFLKRDLLATLPLPSHGHLLTPARSMARALEEDSLEPVRIPITDVFDLHTVQPREVRDVVNAYLEEADRLGLRTLRIIHGRGIGVQRQIVRATLERSPLVAAFGDAPPELGGWGATIVKLR